MTFLESFEYAAHKREMSQPQKLSAIIMQLRAAESKMKEGDHISFAMACLLIFCFASFYFIGGQLLIFTVVIGCLGLAIPLYYWISALRDRRSWYWEPVRREIEGKDLSEMWMTCDRGDWLLWFCAHMIGKPGWPTLQQVVLASCRCARLALKHVKSGETRPLKAIEAAEAWARGEVTLEEVRIASRAADSTTGYGDAAYCGAQAAHSAAWAVYATEDGACFRLAQAASGSASRTAWAAGYEVGHTARAMREQATLRECADIVRDMLSIPATLTNEVPIYDWERQWHTNSSRQRTGRMTHIPIAISRPSSTIELIEKPLGSVFRTITALMVLASAWFLMGALARNPPQYYSMLRWLTCSTAIALVWRGDIQGSLKWSYVLVPIAILFNPIIPLHLKGTHMEILRTWHAVDLVVASAFCAVLALMEMQLWLGRKRRNGVSGNPLHPVQKAMN